jgi:hypothetical protein
MVRERFTKAQAEERRAARLQELEGRLGAAVEQLVSGEDWSRAIQFAGQFRSRSFLNTLLIYVQHTEAHAEGRVPEPFPTYVAGFKQWEKLGRAPAKGQSGYMIRSPNLGRFASETPAAASSWRRLAPRETPKAGEAVREKLVGTSVAYVWDVSQTTGDPIPERPRPAELVGAAPAGLVDGLVAQVIRADFGYVVASEPAGLGTALGLTDRENRLVFVRAGLSDAQHAKTLAHELGHVLLHATDEEGARLHRGIAEVEAESVALMVCSSVGMDTDGYSVPYVAGWASSVPDRSVRQTIRTTGERVRGAAASILGQLEIPTLDDGLPPALAQLQRTMGAAGAALRPTARGLEMPDPVERGREGPGLEL